MNTEKDIQDLKELHDTLRDGTFYSDHDRSWELLGVLRRHLELLPEMARLVEDLSIEKNWLERRRDAALGLGVTDPAQLTKRLEDIGRDRSPSYLSARDDAFSGYTEVARKLVAPEADLGVAWTAGPEADVDERRFSHGPVWDLEGLLEEIATKDGYVVVGMAPDGSEVHRHRVSQGRILAPEAELEAPGL